MKRLAILLIPIFMLAGCAWLQKPVDQRAINAVHQAQDAKTSLQTSITDIQNKPTTTEQDKAMLARLNASLEGVDSFLNKADSTLADASTNGDALLNSVGLLATAFGVPFVGLGVQVLRKSKLVNAYETGIRNLEIHRDGDTVDFAALKIDNADAGINSTLKAVRAKAKT